MILHTIIVTIVIYRVERITTLNNSDWLILKTIAKEKNINLAAQALYISQPALTYRLKNIETELGAKIFIRSNKGLAITPQGEEFLQYTDSMLKEFEGIKRKIALMGGEVSGKLRISMSPNFAKHKLEKVLLSYVKKYPKVDLLLKTSYSSQVMDFLTKDEAHIGIVRGHHKWAEEKYLISTEQILMITSKKISMFDLPKMPYIAYETDVQLKKEILDWWREHYSVPPNITMQINDTDVCRQMIALGLGFSILPAIDYKIAEDNLHVVPLKHKNGEPLMRPTWMLTKTASMQIPTVESFFEHVKQLNNL